MCPPVQADTRNKDTPLDERQDVEGLRQLQLRLEGGVRVGGGDQTSAGIYPREQQTLSQGTLEPSNPPAYAT